MSQCAVRKIGDLPFNHKFAACTNVDEVNLYLCFHDGSSSDFKKCRLSNSPTGPFYDQVPASKFTHRGIGIANSGGKT